MFFRNGIPQKISMFERLKYGDNEDEDKFDKKAFKKILRHLFKIKDSNATI